MLKFKEFLGEAVLDYYRGKKLIATNHLTKRLDQRGSSNHELRHIFRKAAEHLEQNDYGDHNKFLFYSKKYNRAVAFSHQKNTSDPKDIRKHLVATTIFPAGEKYANAETKLVNVEGYSPEFIAYVNTIVNEESRNSEPLSEVMVEGVEFYFLHGQLDNLPFTEFVEVE
jgi:hypothetical protein